MKGPDLLKRTTPSHLNKAAQVPELQLHASATLVVPGDPFGLTPEQRQDKAGEVAQFAVVVPPQFMGRLRRAHVEEAFRNMQESIIERLRKHGVMTNGE